MIQTKTENVRASRQTKKKQVITMSEMENKSERKRRKCVANKKKTWTFQHPMNIYLAECSKKDNTVVPIYKYINLIYLNKV